MMNRRNFIKSSMVLSSALLANSNWVIGDRIKFGYYYPSESTPAPLQKFTGLFEKAGVNAAMENLTGLTVPQVLHKLQSGEYAGVFMLTNLVSDHIPELLLLSDGPDAPSYAELGAWFTRQEPEWDAVLGGYNLKRIPFTHSGSRRGLWVREERLENLHHLRGARVYAEGLWARLFERQGAERVERLSGSAQIDIFVPSNLYAAEQTGIGRKARLHLLDPAGFHQAPGSSFDLYLNAKYWSELPPRIQASMKDFTKEVGEALCQTWFTHDQRLLSSYRDRTVSLDILNSLADRNEARLLRFEQAAAGKAEGLIQSFDREFGLPARMPDRLG